MRNGVRIERHLCERHASEAGIKVSASQAVPEVPTPPAPGAKGRTAVCPACRTTFAEFKQHGLLGCAQCYVCFEKELGPLLERAHDGLSQHRPHGAGGLAHFVFALHASAPPRLPPPHQPSLDIAVPREPASAVLASVRHPAQPRGPPRRSC